MKAYRVKIQLRQVKPPVWRRLMIPSGLTFEQLRVVLNDAMGWNGGHLYAFRFNRPTVYISYDFNPMRMVEKMFTRFDVESSLDAREARIDDYLRKGKKFIYEYDFGDGWEHDIVVEEVVPDYENKYPMVIEFEGKCPPEDVGGPFGYADFLDIINDRTNPERDEMLEWAYSQSWNDYFIDDVNWELERLSLREYREFPDEWLGINSPFSFEDTDDETAEDTDDETAHSCNENGGGDLFSVLERIPDMTEAEREKAFDDPGIRLGISALGRKPKYDLLSLLKSFKVAELRVLARNVSIEGATKMKKGELVEEIYELFMNRNAFRGIAPMIDDNEMSFLSDIMEGEQEFSSFDRPDDGPDFPFELCNLLVSTLLATAYFDGDDLRVIILDEAKKKYDEYIAEVGEMYIELRDELDKFSIAAANLYGVISIDDFLRIVNSYFDMGIEMDKESLLSDVRSIISAYDEAGADYIIKDYALVDESFSDWSDREIKDFLDRCNLHPLKILPKDEFLFYSDYLYFERNDENLELVRFIANKLGVGDKNLKRAEEITAEIIYMRRQWCPLKECLETIEELGISLEKKADVEVLAELLAKVNNNTRIWGNNGNTPLELSESVSNVIPFRRKAEKVGRNEPCPCGSGKKYKNCCGRYVN